MRFYGGGGTDSLMVWEYRFSGQCINGLPYSKMAETVEIAGFKHPRKSMKICICIHFGTVLYYRHKEQTSNRPSRGTSYGVSLACDNLVIIRYHSNLILRVVFCEVF